MVHQPVSDCAHARPALTGIPVRCDVAMTGEITLRGEVLPIGGLKENSGRRTRRNCQFLIPEENVRDLAEIPDNIKNKLEIIPVKRIDRVLELALERKPQPLPEESRLSVPAAFGHGGRLRWRPS